MLETILRFQYQRIEKWYWLQWHSRMSLFLTWHELEWWHHKHCFALSSLMCDFHSHIYLIFTIWLLDSYINYCSLDMRKESRKGLREYLGGTVCRFRIMGDYGWVWSLTLKKEKNKQRQKEKSKSFLANSRFLKWLSCSSLNRLFSLITG